MSKPITETNLPELKFVKKGKVRDLYEVDDYYVIISTDRLSAYDVVMNQGIPDKGKVLNLLSAFWFKLTEDIVPNHLVTTNVDDFPKVCHQYRDILDGRAMLVKKTEVIMLECIVRGYITGSGWKDYKKTGEICGIGLPSDMQESQKFAEPLFTPSTKAAIGEHDENISVEKAIEIVGEQTVQKVKEISINVFNTCSDFARERGIIIADTKFEFGRTPDGDIILIDEVMTPDSSRFWPESQYKVGASQPSFDKQFVRDYLTSVNFNKRPPAPDLPEEIIQKTSEKYREAYKMITGEELPT